MAIVDREGLFSGDRLRRCSNAAQLHFPRLFLASNGYGRLEINYARIVGTAYITFHPIPSETELHSFIQEYRDNYLLFLYECYGQVWGAWDTRPEFLPRYKTSSDRRSPSPPEPAFTEWKQRYRTEIKAFPKSFGNISETFLHGKVRGWYGKANTCASHDARVGQLPPLHDPPFGTDLDPLSEQLPSPETVNEKPHNAGAAKNSNGRAPELTSQQEAWFRAWWAEYWHRRARKAAWAAFKRHVTTEELFRKVMAAVRAQKPEMLQREPSKRPYPATWLNGERWEDEVQPSAPSSTEPPRMIL